MRMTMKLHGLMIGENGSKNVSSYLIGGENNFLLLNAELQSSRSRSKMLDAGTYTHAPITLTSANQSHVE